MEGSPPRGPMPGWVGGGDLPSGVLKKPEGPKLRLCFHRTRRGWPWIIYLEQKTFSQCQVRFIVRDGVRVAGLCG